MVIFFYQNPFTWNRRREIIEIIHSRTPRGEEKIMSHGAYKCSKCGETASSKCIHQRSIFPENQYASVLTNVLKTKHEKITRPDGVETIKHVFIYTYHGGSEEEALDALMGVLKIPGVIASYACDHDWVLQSEKCGMGCCVRKEIA
jgi:hypothetical protein